MIDVGDRVYVQMGKLGHGLVLEVKMVDVSGRRICKVQIDWSNEVKWFREEDLRLWVASDAKAVDEEKEAERKKKNLRRMKVNQEILSDAVDKEEKVTDQEKVERNKPQNFRDGPWLPLQKALDYMVGEEGKKADRPRKLLPDMDQIDQAVLVWKRLGLIITAIVEDVREKGGLTVTVKPEGPIEINLSGLTIRIPVN